MLSPKHRTGALAASLALVSGLLGGCAGSGDTASARAVSATVPSSASSAPAVSTTAQERANRAFARLEHRFRARLGLYMLDTGTGRTVTYRANERFAYCSTLKALNAGIVLDRATDDRLDHVITYDASDLVEYSPITSKHVDTGMTLRAIITAALEYSDNTAQNLLFAEVGGPGKVQKALRGLGDTTTHVDRTETELNDAVPGDVRDTSTPRVLGTDLRRFVLGNQLPAHRRQLLTDRLVHNTTGDSYIRAGLPGGWKVGDKTGSGGYGARNDIAVAWPTHGSPIVIAVLSDRGSKDASSDDALIADATKTARTVLR